MNASGRDQADCAKASSPSPSELVSCQFWSIVHNEVLLHTSVGLGLALLVASVGLNTLLFGVLLHTEALSRQPRYMLLKNLIVSDLLKSLIMAPSMLYCLIHRQTLSFSNWCIVQFFTGTLTIITSLLTVSFAAMERFVYICHGIHYPVVMTKVRMYACLTFIWLLALTLAITHIAFVMSGRPRFDHFIPGFVCVAGAIQKQIAFPLYFKICNSATMVTLLFHGLLMFSLSYGRMYQEARQAQPDSNRVQCTVAFYLGIFLLELLPSAFTFASMFYEDAQYHLVLVLLFLVPPCINPLAYGFRNKEVREALQHLCGFRKTVRRPATEGASPSVLFSSQAPQAPMD